MDKGFYITIGYVLIWCIKYIFIPTGVAILGRLFSERLLRPQPKKRQQGAQRKKRLIKNRLK